MAKKIVKKSAPKTSGKQGKAQVGPQTPDDLDAMWKESRTKAPTTGGITRADIPDGDYVFQLTSGKTGEYKKGGKKGTKYVSLTLTIKFGEHAGTRVSKMHDMSSRPIGNSGKVALDLLSEDLQRLGVDTKKIPSLSKIPDVVSELVKEAIIIRGTVKNTPPDPARKGSTGFQNVWLNDVVSEDELEQLAEQYGDQAV